MNTLPTASIASRVNALLAAALVTLTMLSGIDALAGAEAAPQWAQASATQPA
jgi:hypothetical protein